MFSIEDKKAIARCIGFIVSGKHPVSRLFGLSRQAHPPIRMHLSPRPCWRVQVAVTLLKESGWFTRLCTDRARMLQYVSGDVLKSHGGVQ